MTGGQKLLILTPLKDAAHHVDAYFAGITCLSYPRNLSSISLLESDNEDDTPKVFRERLAELDGTLRRTGFWKQDFGFHIPRGVPRYAAPLQVRRRCTLAKARNHLLFRALGDEDWVLWLDADVISPDMIERLLACEKDVVQPHCVTEYGGTSFDLNARRDHGSRHSNDLRGEGELARLDSVGGTMLLVRASR